MAGCPSFLRIEKFFISEIIRLARGCPGFAKRHTRLWISAEVARELRQYLPKSGGPRCDRQLVLYCSHGLDCLDDLKNYLLAGTRKPPWLPWIFRGVSLQVSIISWAHRASVWFWRAARAANEAIGITGTSITAWMSKALSTFGQVQECKP